MYIYVYIYNEFIYTYFTYIHTFIEYICRDRDGSNGQPTMIQ